MRHGTTRPAPPTPGSVRAHFDGTRSLSPEQTFLRACGHACLAGLAGRPGSGASAAEAADQSETAMAVLRQAVAMGYRNLRRLPDRIGPRPAPRPGRLPPADDGPGDAGRPVRRGTMRGVTRAPDPAPMAGGEGPTGSRGPGGPLRVRCRTGLEPLKSCRPSSASTIGRRWAGSRRVEASPGRWESRSRSMGIVLGDRRTTGDHRPCPVLAGRPRPRAGDRCHQYWKVRDGGDLSGKRGIRANHPRTPPLGRRAPRVTPHFR